MTGPDFDPSLAHDKDYAYEKMLPEETKKVANLKDEKEYFSEQMYREVRRIVADNIQMQALGTEQMLK